MSDDRPRGVIQPIVAALVVGTALAIQAVADVARSLRRRREVRRG
jgi:hypothetical protein